MGGIGTPVASRWWQVMLSSARDSRPRLIDCTGTKCGRHLHQSSSLPLPISRLSIPDRVVHAQPTSVRITPHHGPTIAAPQQTAYCNTQPDGCFHLRRRRAINPLQKSSGTSSPDSWRLISLADLRAVYRARARQHCDFPFGHQGIPEHPPLPHLFAYPDCDLDNRVHAVLLPLCSTAWPRRDSASAIRRRSPSARDHDTGKQRADVTATLRHKFGIASAADAEQSGRWQLHARSVFVIPTHRCHLCARAECGLAKLQQHPGPFSSSRYFAISIASTGHNPQHRRSTVAYPWSEGSRRRCSVGAHV